MEAVPVYSIGGTGNNPWEIMAAMNGNNRGGWGNTGDMWGWLIILLLFGWGGRGGFGGGRGGRGGFGGGRGGFGGGRGGFGGGRGGRGGDRGFGGDRERAPRDTRW